MASTSIQGGETLGSGTDAALAALGATVGATPHGEPASNPAPTHEAEEIIAGEQRLSNAEGQPVDLDVRFKSPASLPHYLY
jgi:hypothetical protein